MQLWHRDGNKVMLMRKVGKHGAGKWGLPGGSADSKDRDDLATAEREAKEEVGGIPAHEVKGQILVKRCGPLVMALQAQGATHPFCEGPYLFALVPVKSNCVCILFFVCLS